MLNIFRFSLLGQTTKEPLIDPFSLHEPPVEAPQATPFFGEFFYMLLMLAILVTIVMLMSWLLKRIVNSRIEQVNASSPIKILEKRSLSTKTTIMLVEIHGKTLLLAETPTSVVQLTLDEKGAEKNELE